MRTLLVHNRIHRQMKYKCVNAVGYEGRLTVGKVYDCGLRNAVDDLLVVITDDGVQSELFPERFEEVKEPKPEPKPKSPMMEALSKIEMPEMRPWSSERQVGEGDRCKCQGTFVLPPVEGCVCHMGHPPCSACVNNNIVCDNCERTPEEVYQGSVFPKALIDRATVAASSDVEKIKINVLKSRERVLKSRENSKDPVERLWAVQDKQKEFDKLIEMVKQGVVSEADARDILSEKATLVDTAAKPRDEMQEFRRQYQGNFATVEPAKHPNARERGMTASEIMMRREESRRTDIEYLPPGVELEEMKRPLAKKTLGKW